ncbi:NAD-dependent epimerase/dehydratase family protein [Ruminococcus sp.]|uniref:NAD-dependent epimerase/dehydratase family protein n=1 Tax=Ruminococcus sp. TaxID=41978 RepID=UPI00386CC6C7
MMTVFMTGAGGGMGYESFKQMLPDIGKLYKLIIFDLDNEKNHALFDRYQNKKGLTIKYGDLLNKDDVDYCVRKSDLCLHIAAFVSPQADYFPKKAMQNNYGSTTNIVEAIQTQGKADSYKFVYIGTVAETGDRMPPIHWGRVGDPIKPSMFDYYAVSKVAAERYVIECGLKYWVSLRQTGIMGPAMAKIRDAIQFHNCLDNVLEYVSDRDSGRAMRNLCAFDADGSLDNSFWGHIYNIGGGESCRVDTYTMFQLMYGEIGFKNLDPVIDPKLTATRNFHGQYYLDSDKLEDYLHFRSDSMQYFYDAYLKELGAAKTAGKIMCKFPGGQKLMGSIIKGTFKEALNSEHGTKHWLDTNMEDHIDAYWGSRKAWEAIPEKLSDMEHFTDWDTVVPIDHGYDESKPESELTLEDMKKAAEFRGGACLSDSMTKGDWRTKLQFRCAFGHSFDASPRLVLEGGHWCPECERKSWNYGERAKVDPFFAQVWNPLHEADELREYPKEVSELDV